jgi:D-amino-acid dehydrogenase
MRIVVVGSGVLGASVAYHAARLGADVLVVDRDAPGQATAAGAGIVCPWTSKVAEPGWRSLADASAEYYPTLVADLAADGEPDVGYRKVGALRLAPGDAEALHRELSERAVGSALAGEISLLSPAAAREKFPPLREGMPAVHVAGGARVDGRLLRDALRRAATRHGARLLRGAATLVRSDDRIAGVEVGGERFDADTVVVAAGAWCPGVLDPVGVHVDVVPQRGQIVHIELSGVDTSGWPVVLPEGSHYLLAFDDHRVVVGATRETGSGFDYRVTAAGLHEVLSEALSVAPGLADGSVLRTRIGFRPAGPDILPLLGTVPGIEGLVVATGLGASGLTLGPHVGRIAADVALRRDPGLDLTPYDPLRSRISRSLT